MPWHGPIMFFFSLWLALPPPARAERTGYIFVSNEQTNDISVIDPSQDYQIIKWIKTSHHPGQMELRKSRDQLLVVCGDDDVIDIVDLAALAVSDHVPIGPGAKRFQLSRDESRVYVSAGEAAVVREVDIADKIIEREVPTGAVPGALALSGDGRTLIVTSETSDWLHIVDLAAGAVADTIAVGTLPRGLLLIPGEKEIWVSNELSGQVSIIDLPNRKVSANLEFLPPGIHAEDVTPGEMTVTKVGATAFIALGRSDHVAIVDTATRKIEGYVPVGHNVQDVALGTGETTLYAVNSQGDNLSIVDVASRKIVRSVAVGHAPQAVRVDE